MSEGENENERERELNAVVGSSFALAIRSNDIRLHCLPYDSPDLSPFYTS